MKKTLKKEIFIKTRIKTEATSMQGLPKQNKQASINFAFDIFDMHTLHSIFLHFCNKIQGSAFVGDLDINCTLDWFKKHTSTDKGYTVANASCFLSAAF